MPTGNWNLEFLNHNAQRRYPLADDADATDATGAFKLPNNFIVELDLPIHSGMNVGPAGFFVQSVSAYAGGYGIVIAYQPADLSNPVTVATALIPRQGFTRNNVFVLGGVGDFVDTVGKVVIGRLDDIDEQPPGFWEFTIDTGRLDPDAVRPIIRGVSSLVVVSGDQRSAPLYGDIELTPGNNMRIDTVIQAGQDPIIRFNAISGEGTVDECVCEGDSAPTLPIGMINGVAPTPSGDLTIAGSDCIQIVTIPNGIRIVDTCAQPCCGCAELERVTQDLERLNIQVATVDGFVDRLQENVNVMSLTVLGSKLNDRGCITCS